ncbi:MAG: hypothetical protein JXJ04_10750 [Spirochaetales bacterium]|nr:hypothetical protein [Spirochaetales bacterium]
MKSVYGLARKLIKMLLAGTFTIIVAACYGIFMDYRLLFHVSDPDGSPIPDLHLTLLDGTKIVDENWTTETGEASLFTDDTKDYVVSIVDEDGLVNGGDFETELKEVTVPDDTLSESDTQEYFVIMHPKTTEK